MHPFSKLFKTLLYFSLLFLFVYLFERILVVLIGYFVLPVLGPTTVRDSLGSVINIIGGDAWYNVTVVNDTQYFSEADYYASRLLSGIDFRAKNLESFDSLENNSVDLYASVRSLYLQDRYRKIRNIDKTTDTLSDDDWEELDTQ